MEEVRMALEEMKGSKAGGPDGVHPRLLKELPAEGIEAYRELFDRSFREGVVPQEWRKGEVVPMLKAGKDPARLGSYRPVCLTSSVGKWMERVLSRRMRWVLEEGGRLSRFQAGFREEKGVGDQLVRLSQAVWDGYQRREKTGLVLYDFERAYDRVWRDGMLWKLARMGVSVRMVRWVQEWLKNRMAWVRVEGVRGKARRYQQGLPQGSVLAPILFLVFINDLVEKLGERVEVSAFADDLAVWVTGGSGQERNGKLQWASEVVEGWAREWVMRVSVEKSTVTLFSMDRRDREMEGLEVRYGGSVLRREKLPCFLGVTYDVGFTFQEQVDKVVRSARVGTRLLSRLAGRDWGWSWDLLRATYMAVVRAGLVYGSAAWGPWLSRGNWEKLERAQLQCARIIGGTLRSAPREGVLEEAGLPPLRKVAESLWGVELEKCWRAREGDPRREWGDREGPRRLVRREDWRGQAKAMAEEWLPEGVSRKGKVLGPAPWGRWKGVMWMEEGERREDPELAKGEAEQRLRGLGETDLIIFTDGSVEEGVGRGGAGMVVTRGDPAQPEKVEARRGGAGTVASSFQAEVRALRMAMEWLEEHEGEWTSVGVATDSQAALRALKGAGSGWLEEDMGEVRRAGMRLGEKGKRVGFVWVPGHCGLVGNEWADEEAKQAVEEDQGGGSVSEATIRRCWKRREGERAWEHERCKKVYGKGIARGEEAGWTRAERVEMARLRTGHSLDLGGYRKRIGMEGSGLCRRCGENEDETVEHVMQCVAGERERVALGLSDDLACLACRPREALAYWRWWRRVRLKP